MLLCLIVTKPPILQFNACEVSQCSDGVTMKMPYGVDALNQPASHPTFPIGLVKTKSGFILTSVETGRLGIICYDR